MYVYIYIYIYIYTHVYVYVWVLRSRRPGPPAARPRPPRLSTCKGNLISFVKIEYHIRARAYEVHNSNSM